MFGCEAEGAGSGLVCGRATADLKGIIMMRWISAAGFLVGAMFALLPGHVFGQRSVAGQVFNRPTVSPYLNLLRGTGSGSLPSYYTLVRPQIEQRQENIRQQAALQQLETRINQPLRANVQPGTGASSAIRGTGHATYFQNYSHFYSRTTVPR